MKDIYFVPNTLLGKKKIKINQCIALICRIAFCCLGETALKGQTAHLACSETNCKSLCSRGGISPSSVPQSAALCANVISNDDIDYGEVPCGQLKSFSQHPSVFS